MARLEIEAADAKGLRIEAKKAEAALQRQQAHAQQLQAEIAQLTLSLSLSLTLTLTPTLTLTRTLTLSQAEIAQLHEQMAAGGGQGNAGLEEQLAASQADGERLREALTAAEAARTAAEAKAAERDSLVITTEELQQELKQARASGDALRALQEQLEAQRILWPLVQHEERGTAHSK